MMGPYVEVTIQYCGNREGITFSLPNREYERFPARRARVYLAFYSAPTLASLDESDRDAIAKLLTGIYHLPLAPTFVELA
jgi:hypothetical protein